MLSRVSSGSVGVISTEATSPPDETVKTGFGVGIEFCASIVDVWDSSGSKGVMVEPGFTSPFDASDTSVVVLVLLELQPARAIDNQTTSIIVNLGTESL